MTKCKCYRNYLKFEHNMNAISNVVACWGEVSYYFSKHLDIQIFIRQTDKALSAHYDQKYMLMLKVDVYLKHH